MTELNFKYWLQGYAEICGDLPNKEQWAMIREHLELVKKSQTQIRGSVFDKTLSNFTNSAFHPSVNYISC